VADTVSAGAAEGQAPPDTAAAASIPDFVPLPDRWRDIQPPPYEVNVEGRWYDLYNRNALKGDFPLLGQNTFFAFTGTSESVGEFAHVPTPAGVSTAEPGSERFFGDGTRFVFNQTLRAALELYHGDAAFKPRDWEIRFTPVLNFNHVDLNENNNVNINVGKGTNRSDSHLGIQELFVEKHLFNLSDRYDFVSVRAGIQRFGSDFREFIFKEDNLGVRLFGNAGGNRFQYNLAWFYLLEKDTNSELNTVFDDRFQQVLVANLYRQDLFTPGYTGQVSVHYNHDRATSHLDENGIPVRPAVLGDVRPHDVKAVYLGWTGDGHLGRINISHALYQVLGTDTFNSAAGRKVTLNARMAALELSVDRDWQRYRAAALYASGDGDPMDGTATGFDGIVEEAAFAGGAFSYFRQQPIRLLGVNLVNKKSLFPDLRPNAFEGQANFVNPGLFLVNLGYDAELTPKLRSVLNVSYLAFTQTEVLELFLNQNNIDAPIGLDYSLGFVYRPFLNNNAIVALAGSALTPLGGFNDIYASPGTQLSIVTSLTLTF
jgi:hypothetical protein